MSFIFPILKIKFKIWCKMFFNIETQIQNTTMDQFEIWNLKFTQSLFISSLWFISYYPRSKLHTAIKLQSSLTKQIRSNSHNKKVCYTLITYMIQSMSIFDGLTLFYYYWFDIILIQYIESKIYQIKNNWIHWMYNAILNLFLIDYHSNLTSMITLRYFHWLTFL